MSALALNHSSGSLRQNLQIQPDGPGTRILQIETHHFIKTCPTTSLNLPQTRDAGFDFQNTPPVPHFVLLEFVGERRTRTNQRHVSAQHIPELRQLIQAALADKAADRSHSWILLNLENGFGG